MTALAGGDPASPESLERLHSLLVEAVRRSRGADPFAAPVTVAEIYQELVPYRSVRAALGLDLNADYEHTLLRLLSGEAGLARVEPAAAREQMERELESSNPNVALYRKFAGCDVWLAAAAAPSARLAEQLAEEGVAEQAAPPLAEELSEAAAAITAVPAPASAEPTRPPEPGPEMSKEQEKPVPAAAAARADAAQCAFCDSALPAGRQVRFCPYCGADQSQRPCAVCGEALQQDWAYCIACGAAVPSAGA